MNGSRLVGREGRRPVRRVASLALLGVLVGGPVLLATGVSARTLDTCLHVLRFCLGALVQVDGLLHGVPVALLVVGLASVLVRRVGRVRSVWRALRLVPWRRPAPGEAIFRAAARHGALDRVRVLPASSPNPAFTVGLLRPRVYLAASLQQELSEEEIEAVLLHELHHCDARDPLRCALAALLADLLFWLPLVRTAADRVLARAELAADDAARRCSGDLALASAILKVARRSRGLRIAAPALAAPGLLEHRLERLLGTSTAARFPPATRRRAVLRSAWAVAALWVLGIASSAAHAAHLPGGGEYCPHHHEHGVLHAGHEESAHAPRR